MNNKESLPWAPRVGHLGSDRGNYLRLKAKVVNRNAYASFRLVFLGLKKGV